MSAIAAQRIGRGGFTGSPITAWCETCEDWAVYDGRGRCVWCEAKITAVARLSAAQSPARLSVVNGLTEAGIYAAHGRYVAERVSLAALARRMWREPEASGYRSSHALSCALRHAFNARGLPLRTMSEAATLRTTRQ